MTRGGKTCWKAIRVLAAGGAARSELTAAERLAALYRFQNGDRSGHHFFVEGQREAEVGDPDQVDWANFPVLAALEAVTCDELRRLRMLLCDGGAETPPNPPGSSGAPRMSVWGVDLRREATPSDV